MDTTTTAVRETALETLRDLIFQGYAGLDQFDDTRFVIHCPEPFLTDGEKAADLLGGYFLMTDRLGVKPSHHACLLPTRVTLALGLDAPDAPRLVVPFAERRRDSGLHRMIDDVKRSIVP